MTPPPPVALVRASLALLAAIVGGTLFAVWITR